MEFVRNLYGSSMEVVMEYGMELVWNNCGISVEEVWNKYGISMEYRGIIIFEQNFEGVFEISGQSQKINSLIVLGKPIKKISSNRDPDFFYLKR